MPAQPHFTPSECHVENNSISLAWQCASTSGESIPIDGYCLELGAPGPSSTTNTDGTDPTAAKPDTFTNFKQVYTGRDPCCTVEGLQFSSNYALRVRAYNRVGHSCYSEVLALQTAHVAWFELAPPAYSSSDIVMTNHNCTLTSTSLDYRTIRGQPGFHSGVHYWEVLVERYDPCGSGADIVVGVAQAAVDEMQMLGKDLHGWSMYVDGERSWFLHNGVHHGRRQLSNGELRVGSVIGVRMDCDRGQLAFYLNDRRMGETVAFK